MPPDPAQHPIFILPGMGIDSSMYSGPWRTLEGATFLDWPPYAGETSLPELADRIIRESEMADGTILIGSSLGGMIACEIAARRRLAGFALIGSAIHRNEINSVLALFHPVAKITPFRLLQNVSHWWPGPVAQMFSRSDAEFIRAMCRAIFHWHGLIDHGVQPFRIHGRFDPVIPLPQNIDCILDTAHVPAMTRPTACVDAIRTWLDTLTK